MGTTGLEISDKLTPLMVTQTLEDKRQSSATKQMFVPLLRGLPYKVELVEAVFAQVPSMLRDGDDELRSQIISTIKTAGAALEVPPRSRDALTRGLKNLHREAAKTDLQLARSIAGVALVVEQSGEPRTFGTEQAAPVKTIADARAILRKSTSTSAQSYAAIKYLPQSRAADADTIGLLNVLLQNGKAGVRESVAETLGTIGPPAKVALPQLAAMAREGASGSIRYSAMKAMLQIAPDAPATIDVYIEAMMSPPQYREDQFGRDLATIRHLRVLETAVQLYWDSRIKGYHNISLQSHVSRFRDLDASAFRIPADVLDGLQSPRIDRRVLALNAIKELDAFGTWATPAVAALLKDPERQVRRQAMYALAGIGQFDQMVRVLDLEDEEGRIAMLNHLQRESPYAKSILPALKARLASKPSYLEEVALRGAIEAIEHSRQPAPRQPAPATPHPPALRVPAAPGSPPQPGFPKYYNANSQGI